MKTQERLTIEDILKPGMQPRTDAIDFEKEPELKNLFEQTRKRQERLIKLMDQPFENLLVTI